MLSPKPVDEWGEAYGIGLGAARLAAEAAECYVAAWATWADKNGCRWTEQLVMPDDVHRAEGFGVYAIEDDGCALWLADFSTARLALDWAHANVNGIINDFTKGR